ncbi:MAG: glycerol-3-phosphate 1-O-acyltransferase PlsY [Kiritimatiellae bacterium]|nr:glycerol-3-phosphate 1-O-acyltransferase PlsY [Kiritimatiellia bacterium]
MEFLWIIGGCVASYLLGAVPCSYLIARARGVDIRKVGSGNVGATNVFRSVGKGWGVLAFFLDALKGAAPALWMLPAIRAMGGPDLAPDWRLAFGAMAVVGHNWPIFLGFKGGKGVATSAGMLLAVAPAAVGIGLLVWVMLFAASKYVSLASIGAAVATPAAAWALYAREGLIRPIVLTAMGLLTIVRHRANLARLRAGTEHRFGTPRAAAPTEATS